MNILEVTTYAIVAMGIGGVLGKILPQVMAACQDFVESALSMVAKIFFVRKTMYEASSQTILYHYLNHLTGGGYGNLDDLYEVHHDHIRPLGHKQSYFVRYTWHTWKLWFLKGRPLAMIPNSGKGNDKPVFVFLRGTIDWKKLMLDACEWDYHKDLERDAAHKEIRFKIIHMRGEWDNGMVGRLKAEDETPDSAPKSSGTENYEPVGWSIEDIGEDIGENPTDTLAMNDNMQEVVREVEFWQTHEEWHKEREIPWKLGVLLHGPPGTGKTSLVRAIAMKLDLPVYSFDLSTMTSREFVKLWEETQVEKTRIILLEDIDAVFHGRDNAIEGHRLSFDVMLNVIDGIEPDDGRVLFVTTNRLDMVDEALGKPNVDGDSTRPGRIDVTFEIGLLDAEGRFKLAYRILKDEELANMMTLDHPNDTPVIFRERCRKLARNMLWSSKRAAS